MNALVRVPASTSNLGAGFDCVGVAVSRWLSVTAHVQPETHRGAGVTIERAGTLRALSLPADQDLLFAGFAAACRRVGREIPPGLVMEADSDIPIARGLGSSAAAIVAGAAAARELLGLDFDQPALMALATELEGHPDNVAAAIHGGAVLAVETGVRQLAVHPSLALVFAVPDFGVATATARAVLPRTLPHAIASGAAARAAALVAGLASGDPHLLAVGLDDVLHVPYRRDLVPGYDTVTAAATAAGACGATLSGSGSAIVAVTPRDRAVAVCGAMVRAWNAAGVAAESWTVMERVGGYVARSLPIRREPVSRAEA